MINNATFVNVTYSADTYSTPGNIFEVPATILLNAAKGDWVMKDEGVLNELKWLFPVRRNRILGVFVVEGWEYVDTDPTRKRVRFKLQIPSDLKQAKSLKEEAQSEISTSNFVVKYTK
jgi:hypothetical protein